MGLELRCNKRLTLAPRDGTTDRVIVGGIISETCNGVLVLRERIVHENGIDNVYTCSRCGARKILLGPTDEKTEETTRKSPVIQEDEDRILEQNR